jgi:glycosyltransferase involved in cell wall biosynthesis
MSEGPHESLNYISENPVNENIITIITSTLNAGGSIELLIESLRAQTAKNFFWIVADGGSTDHTLQMLARSKDVVTHILHGPDFGIYDGLNRAVSIVLTPYYLVIGADDTLEKDAIQNFTEAAANAPADFISGFVRTSDGAELRPGRGNYFRYGHLAYISQHSVGTLIRTDLHKKVGVYSNRFPIAADRHFILNAILNYGASVKAIDTTIGTYAVTGTSNRQFHNALLDIFKVDYELSRRPLFSVVKSIFRYMLNIHRLSRLS